MLIALEPTKDLGSLKYGKAKPFTFEVKNPSQKPIRVDKVLVGCGSCTTAHLTSDIINPGSTVTLNAVFTPGSIGKQNKYIQLKYWGGEVLKLEFTADVHE